MAANDTIESAMTTEPLKEHVRQTFAVELPQVRNDELREKVINAWVHGMVESGATDLARDLQKTTKAGDAAGAGVLHIRAVTHVALGIADALLKVETYPIDRDIVAAGALLHDVGKLLEYGPRKDTHPLGGPNLKHTFSGIFLALEAGLPPSVLAIIAYHSPDAEGTHTRTIEGEIISRADMMSSDVQSRRETGKSRSEKHPMIYLPRSK